MPVETVCALILVATAPGLAGPLPGIVQSNGPVAEGTDRVDGADLRKQVRKLASRALAGRTLRGDFTRLKEAVHTLGASHRATNPKATRISLRLARRIAELEGRVSSGAATREDFAILEAQLLEAEVDHTIARLEKTASNEGDVRADLAQLGELLSAWDKGSAPSSGLAGSAPLDDKSESAGSAPAGRGTNTQLLATLNNARRASERTKRPVDLGPLRRSLAETRLDRALADLERRSLANTVTREDFQRVAETCADRTELLGTSEALALESQLGQALEELKAKAAAGRLTPTAFAKLRSELLEAARAQPSEGARR